jgi:hypothetical protein
MKYACILSLLLVTASLSALDFFPPDSLSAALGAEVNGNSRNSVAAAGVLSLGLDLNRHFTVGLKTAFSHNFDKTGVLDIAGTFRYNLPPLFGISGFFVRAEIGSSIIFEDGASYPAFLGGLGAGWKFFPGGRDLFLEPSVRFGYPFIWGVGFSAGWRFNFKQVEQEELE